MLSQSYSTNQRLGLVLLVSYTGCQPCHRKSGKALLGVGVVGDGDGTGSGVGGGKEGNDMFRFCCCCCVLLCSRLVCTFKRENLAIEREDSSKQPLRDWVMMIQIGSRDWRSKGNTTAKQPLRDRVMAIQIGASATGCKAHERDTIPPVPLGSGAAPIHMVDHTRVTNHCVRRYQRGRHLQGPTYTW